MSDRLNFFPLFVSDLWIYKRFSLPLDLILLKPSAGIPIFCHFLLLLAGIYLLELQISKLMFQKEKEIKIDFSFAFNLDFIT
jgi:hypothetical protein